MTDQFAEFQIEDIPDSDQLTRGCSTPPGIEPESIFQFPADRATKTRAESCYWRKYLADVEDVHALELGRVSTSNAKAVSDGKPIKRYDGFITANVIDVRQIQSGRGFGFSVDHLPENGVRSHSHITIVESASRKTEKNDRRELVHLLYRAFGDLEKPV